MMIKQNLLFSDFKNLNNRSFFNRTNFINYLNIIE